MSDFKKSLKQVAIAYRLACNFDYCPEFEEVDSDDINDLEFSVTKEEVKDACDNWNGNRSDEIANQLDRIIAKEQGD